MDNSAARRQAIVQAVVAASQKDRGSKLASESRGKQSGLDRDNVVDIVRHKVGSVLDDLADARKKVQGAKRLHETAREVDDREVESIIAGELKTLAAEARLAP